MSILISITLGVALLFAIFSLWRQHQATRRLHNALLRKQPCLRESENAIDSGDWDHLCHAANELIEEVNRLQLLRSGQLTQLEATLGSLQEAVLIVNSTNHILLSNSALDAMFPRVTNILGQRLELILHSAVFLDYVTAVRQNTAQAQFEVEFVDGNRSIWVEVTGTNIPSLSSSKEPWALFVLHDITKQKKLEAVRKDFVANVSHELRTPLSVIKGYVETLVDDHQSLPPDDRDRFLRTIQRHTERLNSLLEDLLTLSRLESINPGLRRETADLAALLNSILEDYRARPTSAGHELSTIIDPSIGALLIDPLKITQVLENLIDNAIKYTPKGSHIEVSAKQRENIIEICVRDNGLGIPEADLPHIFERFYRVDKGRSRDKGGTGLGLSIVKHIVQLHGGQVRAESKLGQGTAFYFTLPQRQNSAAEPTAQ